jgi:hypothetical protein
LQKAASYTEKKVGVVIAQICMVFSFLVLRQLSSRTSVRRKDVAIGAIARYINLPLYLHNCLQAFMQ